MESNNNSAAEEEATPPSYWRPFEVADAFGPLFLDEGFCARSVLDGMHKRDAHCPECKELLTDQKQIARYYALKKFTCKICNSSGTAKRGTVLENCSLSPRQYVILSLFLELGFSNTDIARMVGISAEAVRLWKGKLSV